MSDDEWQAQRDRAILAAFQTGRPVFADSEGAMRYADGDREPLPDDVGVTPKPIPRAAAQLRRASRASYWAAISSGAAAAINAIVGVVWKPWYLWPALIAAVSAILWIWVQHRQLELVGDRRAKR